jgi:two-component system sensor kinase FixL
MPKNNNPSDSALDAILNTIVDGVIVIDDDGMIEKYNPACSEIFGYDAAEVIGQNIKYLMPAPYRSEHDDYISNYKTSSTPKIIGIGREVKGARKGGTVFPMYLSVGELPREGRRAFIGIIRDLSKAAKQREAYEALQQSHFHLSRVAAMDQMGAAIAHELNQPLSAIMNYLEAGSAIINRKDEALYDRLGEIMTQSAGQADRAAKILSRLRRFIETGDVEKTLHNVEDLMQLSLDLIQPTYRNSDIDFSLAISPDLPALLVSEVQIQQVLINLIRNACEAVEGQDRKCVSLSAQLESLTSVKIGVMDTGKGMTDEQYEKLYEPFSTDKEGGLGVGLSISRSIISNHEGRLWAERNSPQGTCFYFTLPISTLD